MVFSGVLLGALLFTGGASAQLRDCDFDWCMGIMDVLLQQFAPGFSYPLKGMDNDGNGIREEDSLAMLSSILRGGTRVVNGATRLDSATVASIRRISRTTATQRTMTCRPRGQAGPGNCWLLTTVGYPCRLTQILTNSGVLGPVSGAFVAKILLDLMGGLTTVGDAPATFTFINAYLDAILNCFQSTLASSLQAYLTPVKPDLHLQPSWYYRWGASPTTGRLNRFGGAGNLDFNIDAILNSAEYSASGFPAAGYRETFLTGLNIMPPIHITTQPAGNTGLLTGNAWTMTVGIAGGQATFTYLWRTRSIWRQELHGELRPDSAPEWSSGYSI